MDNLRKLFLESGYSDDRLGEALRRICLRNHAHGVWLIGGFIYRSIAARMYHQKALVRDIDIVVETLECVLPPQPDWTETRTSYGSPRYRKGNIQVDFIPIDTIVSIKRRALEPTIENYITGVPLTIQSVAFDIRNGILLEAGCKNALEEKVVRVNDIEQARYEAGKKKKTVNQIIREKAESLGFTPLYIKE